MVAGAGADFQDLIIAMHIQLLQHKRHHIGLGNCLVASDRQGIILVGLLDIRSIHEKMPRDFQ